MSEPTITPDQITEETPEETPEQPIQPIEAPDEGEESGEEEERLATPEETQEPPPAPLSQKELEKRLDRLAREAERHSARVTEIMEQDVSLLVPCPACETIIPGFVMAGSFNEERRQQVRVFLGDRAPVERRPDPHSTVCEVCDGWGENETGSHVQGYDVVPCIDCGGKGVRGERFAPTAPSISTAQLSAPTNGPTQTGPQQLPPDVLASLKERGYMAIPAQAPR